MFNTPGAVRTTATAVLAQLKPSDSVALMTFDQTVSKMVVLTTDRKEVAEALGHISWTKLFVNQKQREPDLRFIAILISDNEEYSPPGGMEKEMIDMALQYDIAMFDLRLPARGPREITKRLPGEDMFHRVLLALDKHYVLSFTPTPSEPDGHLHAVEVRLADRFGELNKDYFLYHRRSYRTLPADGAAPSAK